MGEGLDQPEAGDRTGEAADEDGGDLPAIADRVRGFDITVVTTAKTDDEGRALLRALGFPLKADDAQ